MLTRSRQTRFGLGLLATVVMAVAALLGALSWAEADRESELKALKAEASPAYLEDLRIRKGLTPYLQAVRTLRHFETWNRHAPLFLIGRWAIEPDREAAWEHRRERHCVDGFVFEDGKVRRFGAGRDEHPATYRITRDGRIEVREDTGLLRLTPFVAGAGVDHLTVKAGDRTLYATRCI